MAKLIAYIQFRNLTKFKQELCLYTVYPITHNKANLDIQSTGFKGKAIDVRSVIRNNFKGLIIIILIISWGRVGRKLKSGQRFNNVYIDFSYISMQIGK